MIGNVCKKIGTFVLFVVSVLALSGMAYADSHLVYNVEVEAEDAKLSNTSLRSIEKPESNLDVRIKFTSNIAMDDFQVEASLRGEERDTIEDITDSFDIKKDNSYSKELMLKLPLRMETGPYDLRVRFTGRTGGTQEFVYPLDIESDRHLMQIRDVVLSPLDEVKAGRALLVSLVLRNRGEQDEKQVAVRAKISALGISAVDYIKEIEYEGQDDDAAKSEELFLRIPEDAKSGDYTLEVEVEYDEGDKMLRETRTIKVVGSEEKTTMAAQTVTVATEAQVVSAGTAGVSYPVTITNSGKSAKTYTVDVSAPEGLSAVVSPSNVVVVNGGETKTVFVQVSAMSGAQAGSHNIGLSVMSDGSVVAQKILMASVAKQASVKKALEVALIVLVVLLVVLGLIVGFNKMKGEDSEKPETYY